MSQTAVKLQTTILRNYYKYFSKFSKGKEPDKKVAWVTSFTPVEILEALDIYYCYPESYAAVIAASGKEKELLEESSNKFLSCDCCSYSCCIEGCLETENGPRGVLPRPDVLIATNNQCSTLPNWWNILAKRYNVPLIILDYPGERVNKEIAYDYVKKQHEDLILRMEELSGNKLDMSVLEKIISNSTKCVAAWKRVTKAMAVHDISPSSMFDDISFLITARCKPETSELYNIMADKYEALPENEGTGIPAFWLGYPLWYHRDRYFSEYLDGFRIVGSNYITWWDLNYSGKDSFEKLYNAYNFTFLNLKQETRNAMLSERIAASGAKCAVTLINKSCKCDFVSAKNISIPQAELEIDMIDREFADEENVKRKIELLKEVVCSE